MHARPKCMLRYTPLQPMLIPNAIVHIRIRKQLAVFVISPTACVLTDGGLPA